MLIMCIYKRYMYAFTDRQACVYINNIYIYIYIYMHTNKNYIHTCVHAYIFVCTHLHIHTSMYGHAKYSASSATCHLIHRIWTSSFCARCLWVISDATRHTAKQSNARACIAIILTIIIAIILIVNDSYSTNSKW